jgi:hypothetical protein
MSFQPIRLSPCEMCPFREHGGVKLSRARAREIIRGLTEEERAFPCHETIEYDDDLPRGFRATRKSRHCYGAAVLLLAIKRPNLSLKLAQAMKLFHPRQLKASNVRTALTIGEWFRFTKED